MKERPLTSLPKAESLSVAEIAEKQAVGEATVRMWVNTKLLPAYRLPGSRKQPIIRVRREDYERFLTEYRT